MASASGPPKDQEEPVHGRGQREPHESTSSSSAAATSTDASVAAAAEGGAVASLTQGRAREQPGDGGRGTDGSSSAAAAVDQKGKGKISASDDREQARRKEERKSDSTKEKLLGSSIRAYHGHANEKLSDGNGKQLNYPNQHSRAIMSKSLPHVDHKKIPMGEAMCHYFGNIDNAIQKRDVALYLMDLDTRYSEFRPVHRDGECFYRSFMFSYLEQVVERVDTREEDRLLAAVRELARRAEHFQWASEFSRRRGTFETLIEKIKGWKCMWERPISTISYDKGELLLELFSSYDTTDDIFAFLRLAAAIWMCTHKTLYERHVTGLGEGHSLEDWCSTQVIPPRVHADNVAMTALSGALGVSLRVENTLDGTSKDLLSATLQSAIQASNTNTGSIEDSYHIAYDTPSVTLVRIDYHFDILYPLPPGATTTGYHLLRPPRQRRGGGGSQQHPGPAAEASSGGAGQREGDPAEGSGRRAARASWFHCCIRGGSKKK